MNLTEVKKKFREEFQPFVLGGNIEKAMILGRGELPVGFSKDYNYVYLKDFESFIESIFKEIADSLPVEEKKIDIELPDTLHRNRGYNQKAQEIVSFKENLLT